MNSYRSFVHVREKEREAKSSFSSISGYLLKSEGGKHHGALSMTTHTLAG